MYLKHKWLLIQKVSQLKNLNWRGVLEANEPFEDIVRGEMRCNWALKETTQKSSASQSVSVLVWRYGKNILGSYRSRHQFGTDDIVGCILYRRWKWGWWSGSEWRDKHTGLLIQETRVGVLLETTPVVFPQVCLNFIHVSSCTSCYTLFSCLPSRFKPWPPSLCQPCTDWFHLCSRPSCTNSPCLPLSHCASSSRPASSSVFDPRLILLVSVSWVHFLLNWMMIIKILFYFVSRVVNLSPPVLCLRSLQ